MAGDTKNLVGRTVGGYAVEKWAGAGSHADVYLARHVQLGDVALKVLRADCRDSAAREAFRREIETTARLEHPHVLRVHDHGESDGLLYAALTYADGGSLLQLLEHEGPLRLDRTVGIVTQVASALEAAHEQSFLHLDIKLTNVLVSSDDHAYLSDFGRALPLSELDASTNGRRSRAFWTRIDVVALADIAYKCLAGVPASDIDALEANLEGLRPLSAERPEIPRGVDAVLAEATARSSAGRYPTARSVARALTEAANGRVFLEPEVAPGR